MNYIYDVLLNFKDTFYDFYDWNTNDNISHIRKIPLFKIKKEDLFNIINNKVKIDNSFLESIYNKTELFTNKGIKSIEKCFLLTDGESVIGINYLGKKMKISSLLIDEELDILEDTNLMSVSNIKYSIDANQKIELKTRNQLEIEKYVKKELVNIKEDSEKLEYLYYECFNKKENNANKIFEILNSFKEEKVIQKLYDFFKMTKIHK